MKKTGYALNIPLLFLLIIKTVSSFYIPSSPAVEVSGGGMTIVSPDIRFIFIFLQILPILITLIIFILTRKKPVWNGLLFLLWGMIYFFIDLYFLPPMNLSFSRPVLIILFGALIFLIGIFQKHFE